MSLEDDIDIVCFNFRIDTVIDGFLPPQFPFDVGLVKTCFFGIFDA